MQSILQAEIKQATPFPSAREELLLNLMRTAATVGHQMEQHFRPYGLSSTQYNVLRILRGAGAAGLCQYEIAERLVAQVPDVPRILERMERSGWVHRERGTSDRRVMQATLTTAGTALVGEMDETIERGIAALFSHLNESDVERLNDLLVCARYGSD